MGDHHGLSALKAAISDRLSNLGPQGAGTNAEINPKAAPAKTYKQSEEACSVNFTRTASTNPGGGGFFNFPPREEKNTGGFGKKGGFGKGKGGGGGSSSKGKGGDKGKGGKDKGYSGGGFSGASLGGFGYETSLKGGFGKKGGGSRFGGGMPMPGFAPPIFDPAMAAAAMAPMMMPMMMPGMMTGMMGGVMPVGAPVANAPAQGSGAPAGSAPVDDLDLGTKLFVGNLPCDIDETAMQTVFGSYGKVQAIALMKAESGENSGQASAFVIYETDYEAKTAINTLHEKYEIRPGEGPISVRQAHAKTKRAAPY